jgi:hypothetical protein
MTAKTKPTTDEDVAEKLKAIELTAQLPKAGVDRFWRVRHIPTQRQTPIRVELMESIVPGSTKVSRLIGFENAVASVKSIVEAAQLALDRNGAYAELIGDYDV